MSKHRRHGPAQRWSAAGVGMRRGRWSCIRTRWRRTLTVGSAELRRSPRSIVGSGDSGATCAASAICSTQWCAPTRILPSGCAWAVSATPRRSRWVWRAALFSPAATIAGDRAAALETLGLGSRWPLLVGVGRLSGEKRWDTVIRRSPRPHGGTRSGLMLVGEGPGARKLESLGQRSATVTVLPRLSDRRELARLLASADALVHGCEAETFCMVAAEARASGMPHDRSRSRRRRGPASA